MKIKGRHWVILTMIFMVISRFVYDPVETMIDPNMYLCTGNQQLHYRSECAFECCFKKVHKSGNIYIEEITQNIFVHLDRNCSSGLTFYQSSQNYIIQCNHYPYEKPPKYVSYLIYGDMAVSVLVAMLAQRTPWGRYLTMVFFIWSILRRAIVII